MTQTKTLSEALAAPERRRRVIEDCGSLIDDEVKAKSGLSGLAIKAAYGVVKAIKPGIIGEAIDHLLDGWITQLEPLYQRHLGEGRAEPFSALLGREKTQVADALLNYTDEKAKHAKNQTLRKTYDKLRPAAKEHVLAAVPGLGRMIDKHV